MEIKAEGMIDGMLKKQAKIMSITIRNILCPDCSRIRGGYYEAVIQIRAKNPEKLLKRIRGKIVSTENMAEGINARMMWKKEAEAFANSTNKRFLVNKSYKLVAEKKGRKIYRNFYCIRDRE